MSIFCDWWSSWFKAKEIIEPEPEEIPTSDTTKVIMRPFVYFVAGAVGGVLSTVVGHPLDTVKANLQGIPAGEPPKYTGVLDCARKIIATQGIGGFYKGLGVSITSAVPVSAINFAAYGLGKSLQEIDIEDIELTTVNELTAKNFFIAGAFSGFFTSVVVVPGERVRLLLQLSSVDPNDPNITYEQRCAPKYNGALDCISKLYKEGGLRNIFKGSLSSMVRDVPGYATYFTTYEVGKLQLADPEDTPLKTISNTILAGGIAGMAYWLVALPGDNLKHILQLAGPGKYPKGMRDVLKEMRERKQLLSLYRGWIPVLLRSFPANAACFLGFEFCKTLFSYVLNK